MKKLIMAMLLAATPAMAQAIPSNNGLDDNTPLMQAPPSESPSGSRIVRRAPKPPPPKPADDAAPPPPGDGDAAAKPPAP